MFTTTTTRVVKKTIDNSFHKWRRLRWSSTFDRSGGGDDNNWGRRNARGGGGGSDNNLGRQNNRGGGGSDYSFLDKFKLAADDKQGNDSDEKFKQGQGGGRGGGGGSSNNDGSSSNNETSQDADADEIFRKMKENGLIPNAVSMLHGLCTDGLVHEAMNLFGLMRHTGTIPDVVIYTAVVDAFCKALKFDDAIRIFNKMHSNAISPNAFTYSVLVQGLCRGNRLDDAIHFCADMLQAGHSPNLVTFVALVDGFCKERGLQAGQLVVSTLRNKGFYFDDKAVRDYMDKNGPFLQSTWEAIFGLRGPKKSF